MGFNVRATNQVDAIGYSGKNTFHQAVAIPGLSGLPAFQQLPWVGRVNSMIRLSPRITATCLDKMAVGTKCRLIWRICSPKPGITLSATAKRGFRSHIPLCRPSATGGANQVAVVFIGQFLQGVFNVSLFVWNQNFNKLDRVLQGMFATSFSGLECPGLDTHLQMHGR